MKFQPRNPQKPGQTCYIAVGEHTGHLDRAEALAVQVHAIQEGEHAGSVEFDIRENFARRIIMGDEEAEALAHVFIRMQGEDGQRVAEALLDAAHVARQALGKPSIRRPTDSLK